MITLVQYPRLFGIPNASPFCMKLETWLRLAKLDYQVEEMGDPRKAPKGKLPFIRDDRRIIADSRLAIEHLQKAYQIDLDQTLTEKEKAISHSMAIMLEEHYYWGLLYNRWIGENWSHVKREFFQAMPPIIRNIVPTFIQKGVKEAIHGQGLGRHDEGAIYHLVNHDMLAISSYMGDSPYLMGDTPTTVDATLYGLLANVLNTKLDSPLKKYIEHHDNLVSYTERMTNQLFVD